MIQAAPAMAACAMNSWRSIRNLHRHYFCAPTPLKSTLSGIFAHSTTTAAAMRAAVPKPDSFIAAPVYGTVLEVGVGDVVPFVEVPLVAFEEPMTIWKLAQVILVVFELWITTLLSPKKDMLDGSVLKNASTYCATKLVCVILPCLPARSPTWHVAGAASLQG
jgi:hypothetical protein